MASTSDFLLFAAIDFGTTYSGYAFGVLAELAKDVTNIQANQAWVSGQQYLLSLKTPTCLLLDSEGKFRSFGFDAENIYNNIILDEEQEDYYFFRRFKMDLHKKTLSANMEIKDVRGKTLPALTVFSLSIKAMKNHLEQLLDKRGTTIDPQEVQWVLTVPAIWSDSAKQLMRKAAVEAGIPSWQLKLALEPEAASIYCQHLSTERQKDDKKGFTVSKTGTRYMVIDLGGGTADITVHEKLEHGKLRELYKASGGACGGTAVDKKLLSILTDIVGEAVISAVENNVEAHIDLYREFEVIKRNIRPDQTGKVTITIPYITFDSCCQDLIGKSFKACVKDSPFGDEVTLTGNKLRINVEIVQHLFNSVIDEIVSYVEDIMDKPDVCNVSRFLLVGGFSESAMVQGAIKNAFPDMKIIIPNEPGLAVLKGAVIFGYLPDPITSRIIKYSYGVKTAPVFQPGKHDEGHKTISNDVTRCKNVFSSFMAAGTPCPTNHTVVKKYRTNEPFQRVFPLEVFYSYKDHPEYTDEGEVQKLSKMEVKIPNPSEDRKLIEVHFQFGDTEIKALAFDTDSSEPCESTFDLI